MMGTGDGRRDSLNRELLLILLTGTLVVVAVVAAIPWFRTSRPLHGSPIAATGDALAAGIFLGAGLIHMLPDAAQGYAAYGTGYPWPFVICGATILGLALLEHLALGSGRSAVPALAAAIALAAHSFLAGAALGATSREAAVLALFLALIAHKGAASFSLAQVLTESPLSRRRALTMQNMFIAALPLGVALGAVAIRQEQAWPLAKPTILALGAGTFLHFGLQRHRARAPTSGSARWVMPWFGFALMALIAVVD